MNGGSTKVFRSNLRLAFAALFVTAACGAPPGAERASLVSVGASTLCVTSGTVQLADGRLRTDAAGMRAVVMGGPSQLAELSFSLLGRSREVAPLANGELRQQIGLKLRAQDSCNVVYVMWHVSPQPGIAVSVKSNPGQSTHAQCGDRGYINLPPQPAAFDATIRSNEPRTLRAEIVGYRLTVFADDAIAWQGMLPEQAFAFDGPSGVRTDNGAFEFDLKAPSATQPSASCVTD